MGREEFVFLLIGLKWTVVLSAVGFVCGCLSGLCVALARTSGVPLLERVVAGYIAVFQGTPLLMQLFVVYYGLALVGLRLDAWVAVAVGLTLHASAYLGEIWRGAIEAVPRGQTEAAKALSLRYVSRMKDVILPQALRISLPATIGFLVQLIKGTSLASIVGFTELTRAGNIISNQIFEPLTVFGIVGALYFLMCLPLTVLGARLERRFAVSAR
jgi:polar amino acid transport system permease protein